VIVASFSLLVWPSPGRVKAYLCTFCKESFIMYVHNNFVLLHYSSLCVGLGVHNSILLKYKLSPP
jgi:hypothetical protein